MNSSRSSSIAVPPVGALFGILGVMIVAVSGVLIRATLNNGPTSVDLWWHDLMAGSRSGSADVAAQTLNVVGGTMWMTLVTAAIVAALLLAKRRRGGITIGLTVALAAGASAVLKAVLARPRPLDGVVDVTSDSFPSGHVTTAAALTVAIALAFPRVWTWALAAVWIASMALSRTYLLVHWSTDVLAAVMLSASMAVLVAAVASIVIRKVWPQEFLKKPSVAGSDFTGIQQSSTETLSS